MGSRHDRMQVVGEDANDEDANETLPGGPKKVITLF